MKLSLRSEHALLSLIQLARTGEGETPSLETLAASQQIHAGALAEILEATYECQIALFFEIATLIVEGKPLPVSTEKYRATDISGNCAAFANSPAA